MKQLNRFSKNKDYLCLLSCCKNKLRRAIILNSNKDQIFSVCECVINVSNGNIKISKEDFVRLKKFKKIFRKLLNKSAGLKEKKAILVQRISSIIAATISKPSD